MSNRESILRLASDHGWSTHKSGNSERIERAGVKLIAHFSGDDEFVTGYITQRYDGDNSPVEAIDDQDTFRQLLRARPLAPPWNGVGYAEREHRLGARTLAALNRALSPILDGASTAAHVRDDRTGVHALATAYGWSIAEGQGASFAPPTLRYIRPIPNPDGVPVSEDWFVVTFSGNRAVAAEASKLSSGHPDDSEAGRSASLRLIARTLRRVARISPVVAEDVSRARALLGVAVFTSADARDAAQPPVMPAPTVEDVRASYAQLPNARRTLGDVATEHGWSMGSTDADSDTWVHPGVGTGQLSLLLLFDLRGTVTEVQFSEGERLRMEAALRLGQDPYALALRILRNPEHRDSWYSVEPEERPEPLAESAAKVLPDNGIPFEPTPVKTFEPNTTWLGSTGVLDPLKHLDDEEMANLLAARHGWTITVPTTWSDGKRLGKHLHLHRDRDGLVLHASFIDGRLSPAPAEPGEVLRAAYTDAERVAKRIELSMWLTGGVKAGTTPVAITATATPTPPFVLHRPGDNVPRMVEPEAAETEQPVATGSRQHLIEVAAAARPRWDIAEIPVGTTGHAIKLTRDGDREQHPEIVVAEFDGTGAMLHANWGHGQIRHWFTRENYGDRLFGRVLDLLEATPAQNKAGLLKEGEPEPEQPVTLRRDEIEALAEEFGWTAHPPKLNALTEEVLAVTYQRVQAGITAMVNVHYSSDQLTRIRANSKGTTSVTYSPENAGSKWGQMVHECFATPNQEAVEGRLVFSTRNGYARKDNVSDRIWLAILAKKGGWTVENQKETARYLRGPDLITVEFAEVAHDLWVDLAYNTVNVALFRDGTRLDAADQGRPALLAAIEHALREPASEPPECTVERADADRAAMLAGPLLPVVLDALYGSSDIEVVEREFGDGAADNDRHGIFLLARGNGWNPWVAPGGRVVQWHRAGQLADILFAEPDGEDRNKVLAAACVWGEGHPASGGYSGRNAALLEVATLLKSEAPAEELVDGDEPVLTEGDFAEPVWEPLTPAERASGEIERRVAEELALLKEKGVTGYLAEPNGEPGDFLPLYENFVAGLARRLDLDAGLEEVKQRASEELGPPIPSAARLTGDAAKFDAAKFAEVMAGAQREFVRAFGHPDPDPKPKTSSAWDHAMVELESEGYGAHRLRREFASDRAWLLRLARENGWDFAAAYDDAELLLLRRGSEVVLTKWSHPYEGTLARWWSFGYLPEYEGVAAAPDFADSLGMRLRTPAREVQMKLRLHRDGSTEILADPAALPQEHVEAAAEPERTSEQDREWAPEIEEAVRTERDYLLALADNYGWTMRKEEQGAHRLRLTRKGDYLLLQFSERGTITHLWAGNTAESEEVGHAVALSGSAGVFTAATQAIMPWPEPVL